MQRNYYIIYFLICLYVLWQGKKGRSAARVQRVVVAADAADFEEKGRGSAAGCVEGLCSLRSGGDSTCGAEDGGGALRAQIIKKAGPHPPSFRPKRSGVEKSPSSDCTGGITAGDLSTQSIMGAVPVYLPYRYVPPLEMTKEPCLDPSKKRPSGAPA